MSESKKMKIVWAVDPWGEVPGFQGAAASVLRKFEERMDFEVHPMHLYGGYPLDFRLYTPPALSEADRASTRDAFAKILKASPLKDVRDLEILVSPYVTLRQGVTQFGARSEQLGADLIVATTHARQGITRWLIGSFAEALIESSATPVLIINPENGTDWKADSVLFATDFSDLSKEALLKFLPFARALGAEIRLFHKVASMAGAGLAPSVATSIATSSAYTENVDAMQRIAREWEEMVRSHGVKIRSQIDGRLAGSPAESIVAEAAREHAWVAISAQSKPNVFGALGSVARRIARSASAPVWIYRSKGMTGGRS